MAQSPLAEVLHELIDAARHVLIPNRVGELHALVDLAEDAANGAQEAAPVVTPATPQEAAPVVTPATPKEAAPATPQEAAQ